MLFDFVEPDALADGVTAVFTVGGTDELAVEATVVVGVAVVVGEVVAVVVVVGVGTAPDGDSVHSTYDQQEFVHPDMIEIGVPPLNETEFDFPAQPVTRTLSSESTATP